MQASPTRTRILITCLPREDGLTLAIYFQFILTATINQNFIGGGEAPALTVRLALSVLVWGNGLLFFNYYSTIHATEEVNMVARTYLLQMEFGNCLEQDEINALVARLTELGMTNINLSGNFDYSVSSSSIKKNEYPAAYGEEVYLLIEGVLNVDTKTVRFFGVNLDLSKPEVDLSVQKKGVAVK